MKFSAYDPAKHKEIRKLFIRVFGDAEGEKEGRLIGTLVDDLMSSTDKQDLYGFTVSMKERILGCVFFSRIFFDVPVKSVILSPVAVDTACQRQGIGQKLIGFGLHYLKEAGEELILTYGDPEYYAKTGFTPVTEEVVKAPLTLSHPHGWLAQSLIGHEITPIPGNSRCVAALNNQVYW